MADCLVRLGLALVTIVLITSALYQYGGRPAVAVEPPMHLSLPR